MNAVRALLEEHDQIVQEIDGGNDYGEDLFVMLTENGHRTGVSIAIQVKSGAKYKRVNGYSIPVDEHADDWRNSLLPVFGVVFDVETKRLFWVNLKAALEGTAETLTWVKVDSENELTGATIAQFLGIAHDYARTEAGRVREISLQVFRVSESQDSVDWFIGRQAECMELQNRLLEGAGRKFLITGMAGVGKTSLVNKLIRDSPVQSSYPGGVIFLDMHGFSGDRRRMGRPGASYAPLLTALGVSAADMPADVSGQAAAYHRFLEGCAAAGKNILLVFDNVAEASQVAELFPKSDGHGIIVTSRVRLGIMDGLEVIHLDCMEPGDSEDIFRATLGPRTSMLDATPIRELCDLCGHLPLALRIAVAIVKEDPQLDVRDLIEELTEAKTRLDVLQYGDTAVRAALEVSFRRLDDDLCDPFCQLSVNPGTSISEEIAAVAMETSMPRARSVLRRLSQASLVSRDQSSSRWKLHDLVYLYSSEKAQELVSPEGLQECFVRISERYESLAEQADFALRGDDRGKARFRSVVEALGWFDDEHLNIRAAAWGARDSGFHEASYYLSMHLVLYFDMRMRVDDALQCSLVAYESARALKDAERQVRSLNNIGLALTAQRSFEEAIQKLTKATAIAERIGFLEGRCDSTISLGSAVRQGKSPRAAIPILREALQLAKRRGNVGSIASSLTNLGSAYREAGELGSAANVLSESIAFHRVSGDRRREASAHGGLGAVFSNMGRLDAAVQSYRKAFAGYEEVQDYFGVNLTWMNLGATYLSMGKLVDARACLGRACIYFNSVGSGYYEAHTLMNLGNVEAAADNILSAREFYQQGRAKYEEVGALDYVNHANDLLAGLGSRT
ncbi:tetratricopeptide repeat protein [Streptomyces albireticuli]|uniref:tetratricopeptide repeat protein n=1 Tax=Streptomyces albireticuli TaxID=1940 RepID=UPI001E4104D7|nr:tetratricopeptide repeat protein [Streptomyces albireticuli]MCD9144349.1 tetratricopeptide repeat protein [Streptomyces albireticuli]